MTLQITPRILRYRDAPTYLGMDRTKFDTEVRPTITEIPIGARGIGFDRIELDDWLEAYIAACGRPGRNRGKGEISCEPEQKASSLPMTVGELSTKSTKVNASFSGSEKSARTMLKRGSGHARQKLTLSGPTAFDAAINACGQMLHRST